uniref:Uncharacterized protein n=1 Tax=viral metagenome TaxID=1070528 RepID=A0A6M3KC03_9ZZZZ
MSSVKIKSINIEVGTKKFNITVDEALKLQSILNELFGKDIIKKETVIHHNHLNPWYFDPPYSEPLLFSCSNSAVGYTGNETLKITC